MYWLDEHLEKLNNTLTENKDKLTGSEYAAAAQETKEASKSLIEGFKHLNAGDRLGGAAALLEGMGQLTKLGALIGPVGAAAGGVFSLFTGIIASILEAFNPEKESLLEEIKKTLVVQALIKQSSDLEASETRWRNDGADYIVKMAAARDAVIAARKAGRTFDKEKDATDEMFFPENYTPEMMVEGVAWDKLKVIVNAPARVQEIDDALDFLGKNLDQPLEEWGALMDQVVGYMFRMWLSMPGLSTLVDRGSHGGFISWHHQTAASWSEKLRLMEFPAQNNCRIYTRWHKGGAESFDTNLEPLYQRMGVTLEEWTAFEEVHYEPVRNFAVSSSGTIFSVAEHQVQNPGHEAPWDTNMWKYVMFATVGRRGATWKRAKNSPEGEQIFIGEMPDVPHTVVVACTHDGGRMLSICGFNDATEEGENWSPDDSRWGDWHPWWLDFKVASVAIAPRGNKEYGIYVLGLNYDLSVTLYELPWEGSPKPVEGFHWSKAEVENIGAMNLLDAGRWSAHTPYSCAISLAPFAVQLGSSVRVKVGTEVYSWDLRGEPSEVGHPQGNIGDGTPFMMLRPNLKTHQGKFYSDGTFVTCSNQGVDMLYWNSDMGKYVWKNDPTNEGEIVQKIPLRNGGLYRALQDKFRSLA
ncbi:MAG TPA: hypothetical protein VEZ40_21240 [Pyrinomonadaceae bacterium]|nr:hypothetical protein [Pyrinomonadaceae bacterium]